MIKRLLVLLFLFQTLLTFGQLSMEGNYHHGFLLPHRSSMHHLPRHTSWMGELRLNMRTSGAKDWHQLYRKPTIALSLKALDLGNEDILGYGYSLAAVYSNPFIEQKRWSWHGEIGAGLGLISRPFNRIDNYQNIAIGSYLNAFIMAGTRLKISLSENFELLFHGSFNHFSNAAVSLPNLGLNYPVVGTGLKYNIPSSEFELDTTPIPKKIEGGWQGHAVFGAKEIARPRGQKFLTWTAAFGRRVGLTKKGSMLLSAEALHNNSLTYSLDKSYWQVLQLGLSALYQMHVDDFQMFIGGGLYILDPDGGNGRFYHRAGMRYFITKNWGVNLSLKTHLFRADYFEFGLAYRM